jgi:hypothetical protein
LMQEVAVSLHCTRIEDMYFHIMWQCFCHSLVLFVSSDHPWLSWTNKLFIRSKHLAPWPRQKKLLLFLSRYYGNLLC